MEMDKCKGWNCNSVNYYLRQKGKHVGIYCIECDKWVKWIKQDDIPSDEHIYPEY